MEKEVELSESYLLLNVKKAVDYSCNIYQTIIKELSKFQDVLDYEFVFLGHSMGGTVLINLINRCKQVAEKTAAVITMFSPLLGADIGNNTEDKKSSYINDKIFPQNQSSKKGFLANLAGIFGPILGQNLAGINNQDNNFISFLNSSDDCRYLYYLFQIEENSVNEDLSVPKQSYDNIQFHFAGAMFDEIIANYESQLLGNDSYFYQDLIYLQKYQNKYYLRILEKIKKSKLQEKTGDIKNRLNLIQKSKYNNLENDYQQIPHQPYYLFKFSKNTTQNILREIQKDNKNFVKKIQKQKQNLKTNLIFNKYESFFNKNTQSKDANTFQNVLYQNSPYLQLQSHFIKNVKNYLWNSNHDLGLDDGILQNQKFQQSQKYYIIYIIQNLIIENYNKADYLTNNLLTQNKRLDKDIIKQIINHEISLFKISNNFKDGF